MIERPQMLSWIASENEVGIPLQLHTMWTIDRLCGKAGYREPLDQEARVIKLCLQTLDEDIKQVGRGDGWVLMGWGLVCQKVTGKDPCGLSNDERKQAITDFLSDMRARLAVWLTLEEHMFETWKQSSVITSFLVHCYYTAQQGNSMKNRGHPRSLLEHGLIQDVGDCERDEALDKWRRKASAPA